MNKFTYVTVLLLLVAQFSFSQDNFKRISIPNPDSSVIFQLAEQGIDFRCGANHTRNSIQLELSESDLQILNNFNIQYSVDLENVSDFYNKRAVRELPQAKSELEFEKSISQNQRASISSTILGNPLQYAGCTEYDWAAPANFNLGSMGGCLTLSEMKSELDDMYTYSQTNSLDIVSQKQDASPTSQTTWGNPASSITNNSQTYSGQGTTRWDPETIYYVRITGDESTTTEGTRPQILFTSMIHSREVGALMSNIYFMWYLIENYNTDPGVKQLVDNNELYFIPVVNPDGLRWNEHLNSSGGGMQRKNCRPNTGGTTNTTSTRGVDLNRNFDYFWGSAGTGSSGTPTSDSYRGPSRASEPETQIIVDFTLARNFETCIWNHTYANVIPHPYGGNPSFVSGREDEMHKMHEDMTRYNRYVSGATTFTPANGIADDWMVGGSVDGNGSTGMGSGREILATTPEHGNTGFWPSPSEIVPIAKRSMRISFTTAYYGGKYARFHDLTQSDINSLSSNLSFGIERLGQTASDFTITVTPISTNISSIASPATESGMGILEQRNVTASLTLDSGILANEKIEYNVKLSNDQGIFYDANFEKYYQPTLLFSDNPDTDGTSNWTVSGGWTTTNDSYSGTTAITDGTGSYGNNATKTLTSGIYDLSGSTDILVQFYTKWDIERNFDFVEILGSTDGSTWLPLCGNYSKPESSSNTNDHAIKSASDEAFQGNNSSGQVYDGDRIDNWVMEEILIDGSNNSFLFESTTARFRFRFRSDSSHVPENYSTTRDGFFIDDFKITKVQIPCDNTNPPNGITADVTTTALSAIISWDNIPSATYDLRYRQIGAPSWTEITDIATNSYTINGLSDATDYEVQINTRCVSTTSTYSASVNFTATACTGGLVNTFPYTESFESGIGSWSQETGDDIDWDQNSGGTPSTGTGPSGASDVSQYLYTEATGNGTGFPNKSAQLIGPCFDLSNFENSQIEFDYHMFGVAMGSLAIDVSTDNGSNYTNLLSISGERHGSNGAAWTTQIVDLSAYDGQVIKLRFHGTTGTDFTSDMSIDKINFTADAAAPSAAPTAICQDITVQLDNTGSVTITPNQIDNGSFDDGTIVSYSLDVDTFDCTDVGTPPTVTLTVEDNDGQIDSCTATVTIQDLPAPNLVSLPDLTDECSVSVSIIPTATDCSLGTILGLPDLTVFNTQGTHTIVWQYINGNGIVSQNQTVIIDDVTAPVTPTLTDVFADCSVTPVTPTTSDNCEGTITGTTTTSFPITTEGLTVVTWTFDDGNGNSTTADQNVTISATDNTPPITPTLADVNVGECSGTPTAPTTTDVCEGTITGTTTTSFPIATQGTTVVTWTFDDGNGNSTTADQNVIVDDITAPVTPTLADVNVGECSGTPADPTTTDNCEGTITGTTTTSFPITTQGTTVVTWTFDDGNGNSTTADQNVIVDDITAPVTPTLADVNVGECSGTPADPTTTDNCEGTITGTTTTSFPITTQGTTVVTWTFDDGNGNSTTADQNVIVDDITDPVTPTLADVTGECTATAVAPTTTDVCAGTITGTTSDPLTYSTQGTHTITWNFDDGNGQNINVTQDVVIDDITDPVTPTLADVTGECTATAVAPTTTDACAGTITGTTSDPLTYSTQGTHTITWNFDDGNGQNINVTQDVVIDDITDPVTPTLADVTGECTATAVAPTTTDVCAGTITGTTSDPLTYSTQGTHTITWNFDDGNGQNINVTQDVVIDDITDPVTPTLADVTGECTATAVAPTTTDACAGTITGTTSDPLTYSTQGTHTITWNFDDGNGQNINVTQDVVIDDITDPVTPTLADVTGECTATAVAPTTTDACAGTITGTTSDPLTYSTQGTHTITWNFDDGNGQNINVTQDVVIDDITDPVTPTLANVTGECTATAVAPTTTDACAGTITGTTSDPLTYSTQGTHTITWNFDDGNGQNINVTQDVVIDDITDPVTPTLADVTGECTATAVAPTTTDACAGIITGTTSDPLTYSTQGTHTITWNFDDGNGQNINVTQDVVIDDITDPVTPTLADVTGECTATAVAPTTTDACAGTITGTTSDPLTYSTQGTHTITWNFDDGNGQNINVTQDVVIDDITDPVTPTLADVTGECTATAVAPTTTDACAGTITGTTSDPLTYSTQGTHTITWNFDDGNGQNINVTQDVVIDDITDPVTPTLADVTGECTATAVAPTTTDACAGTITGTTSDPLTYSTQGTHTITWNFDDGNGQNINVTQDVVIDDITDPVTPTLADVTGECTATAVAPTTTDACAGTITGTTSDPLTYSTQGTHTITWNFDDGNGQNINVTQDVVIDDITDPVTPTLADVTGECTATAVAPTTTDACAGTITGTTSDPLTYSTQGTHTITWNFDDGNGQNINVTQDVVIDDITDPVTPTLADVTGECTATAVAPTTTDACAGTITGTTSDPLTYSTQGTHTITWNFDDGNGQNINVTQDVVIDDITDPVTPTLADVTGECTATAVAPTTTDVCAGTITGTTSDPLTYSTQGTHTITWNFDDGNGQNINVTQDVVIDDITDPVTPTLADVTGECTATAVAPTTTDACAGTITGTTSDPLTYSTQGTHTITWNFDDGNGQNINVTQDVVIDDITDPVTPTLADVTGECTATAVAPTTTDVCAGTITGTTSDPLTYSTQGTHTITWNFDDGNGQNINVTQDVVIDDITDPVTPTLADVTGECTATAVAPTTTDACAGTITGTTSDPLTYSTQGTHTITWNFDDGNGQNINVTQDVVIDDITDPVCAAKDITIDLLGGTLVISGADIDNGSSDNCGIASLVASPNTFGGADIGDNTVTLTVTDNNGNSSNCDVTVTVEDSTLGSQEFEEIEGVNVYPNPFNEELNIKLPPSYYGKTINIDLLDIRGRLVKSLKKEYLNSVLTIEEFDDFEDGSYFIKITNNLEKILFKQLIKK